METFTLTAGQQAAAGAARLRAVAPVTCTAGSPSVPSYAATHAEPGQLHQTTSWISGALAKPATFMVFDGKNRPIRPLSELSP